MNRIHSGVACAMLLLSTTAQAADPVLASPYNIDQIRSRHGVANGAYFKCAGAPRAITSLDTGSVYKEGDSSHSEIDEDAQDEYEKKMAPVRDYMGNLSDITNLYLTYVPVHKEIGQCAGRWLYSWALHGAFSDLNSKQANIAFGSTLSGIALSYLQVKDSGTISAVGKTAVETWLSDLARRQMVYYDRYPTADSSRGNHRYWAGLGVSAVGVATNNRAFLDWGINSARIGIAQISADGTLPLELSRGTRARDYHLYATGPLVMTAEIAAVNGVDLYSENGGALHKLVKTTADSVRSPSFLEKLLGKKLLVFPKGRVPDNRIAWLEVYNARFPSADNEATLRLYRPVENAELGGYTTLLFAR